MASLLTSSETAALTGIFNDIFDTFSRNVIVHKEPIRTVVSNGQSYSYGYGESSNEINYEYTPVSGVFPATVKYGGDATLGDKLRIKVKKEGMDFITEGRTEKITVDNKDYNVISFERPKKFLTSEFFIFYLEIAK